jgi:hypothetical protein
MKTALEIVAEKEAKRLLDQQVRGLETQQKKVTQSTYHAERLKEQLDQVEAELKGQKKVLRAIGKLSSAAYADTDHCEALSHNGFYDFGSIAMSFSPFGTACHRRALADMVCEARH